MSLTFGLSWKHPIVILSIVNVILIWIFLYYQSVILHEPYGRFPYSVMAVGAVLFFLCPVYLVAHPEEMHHAFLGWRKSPRLSIDRPIGGLFRVFGYLFALATTVVFSLALLESIRH